MQLKAPKPSQKLDPMLPLMNLSFLLLLFFLLAGVIGERADLSALPEAKNATDQLTDEDGLILTLEGNGGFLLNGSTLSEEDLNTLPKLTEILLQTDADKEAANLITALKTLKQAGFTDIRLAVRSPLHP